MKAPFFVPTSTLTLLIRRSSLAVDHPWYAESIDQHTKAGRPESLLDRHYHFTPIHQGVEYTLCLLLIPQTDMHIESGRGRIMIGGSVATHQNTFVRMQAGVDNLVPEFGRDGSLGGGTRVGHHGLDLTAQNPLIELECFFTFSVEHQIRYQLHSCVIS